MLLRGESHKLSAKIDRILFSVVFALLPLVAIALIGYVLHAGFENDLKPAEAATGINKMISYQAKMTDVAGVTVPDGTYWLTIRIYDSASAGTCLYTASGTSCGAATSTPVTVTNGLFSIMIGDTASQNALTLDFNSDTYYLGIQVGNDSEMTPRKRLGAAGYAINSDTLDGYNTSLTGGSTSFVPVTNSAGDLFLTQRVLTSSTVYASGSGTSTFSYGATFATTGGNVGIGTSTPSEKLSLVGNFSNLVSAASPVRQIATTSVGVQPQGIYVSGRYAYIANYVGDSVSVVDISNPAAPVEIATVAGIDGASDIYVFGRYAYVTSLLSSSFKVIDVLNPTAPTLIASADVDSYPGALYVFGHYAYSSKQNDTISIVNISNPAAPMEIATVAIDDPGAIYVSGRYAYVTNYNHDTITVLDISNPAAPVQAATTTVGYRPIAIGVSGHYAYVANYGGDSISVVDISNPAAPVEIAAVAINDPISIYVSGRYAYVANYDSDTITVLDISNPAAPMRVAVASVGADPGDIFVSGRYAYVTNDYDDTISVVDISGAEISSLMAHSLEAGNIQSRNDIIAQGNINAGTSLFVGAGGILSNGALAISSTTTPSYFGYNIGLGNTAPSEKLTIGLGNIALGDGATTSTIGFATSTYIYAHPRADTSGYSAFTINTTSTLSAANLLSIQNNGSNVFRVNPTTSTFSGALAVGTSTASIPAKLSVDGSVLFSGNSGATPVSGPGARMMWIPFKYAFRAGAVDPTVTAGYSIPTVGNEWDDTNIGEYSIALGLSSKASAFGSSAIGIANIASGLGAMALGVSSTASGSYSTAMGLRTTASGGAATAMGGYTTASGSYSTAIGSYATASGGTSVAMGTYATASGGTSVAMGGYTTASGSYSTAIGSYATASGVTSVAMGANTTASANYTTAMGLYTTASGANSTAMGLYTTASGNNSFALGQYASSTATNSFTIGYGSGATTPLINSTANSLAVGFNSTVPTLMVTGGSGAGTYGNVGIGNTAPGELLTIGLGNIALGDGSTTSTLGFATSTYIYTHPARDLAGYSAVTINTTSTLAAADLLTVRNNGTRIVGISPTTSTFSYGATFATTGGNIGIGTASPGAKLSIEGAAAQTLLRVGSAVAEPLADNEYTPTMSVSSTETRGDAAPVNYLNYYPLADYHYTISPSVTADNSFWYGARHITDFNGTITNPAAYSAVFGTQNLVSVSAGSSIPAVDANTNHVSNYGNITILTKGLWGEVSNMATSVSAYGLQGDVLNQGSPYTGQVTPNITTARGGRFRVTNQDQMGEVNASIANATVVYANTYNYTAGAGSAIITTAKGYEYDIQNSGGTITNSYGLYFSTPVNTGTISNHYGVYLADQTVAGTTNNYAIYSAGGANYFAGNVGIGNTAPSEKLTIGLGNIALGDGATTSTLGFATSTYIYAHPAQDLAGYSAFTINTTSTLSNANLLSIQNNGGNVFRVNPATSTFSGALAVGTSTASIPAKLSVDGSVLFSGNSGATPVSGPGTRLMWIPSLAAFRVGSVDPSLFGDGTEWDEVNIGLSSIAMGTSASATGTAAISIGDGTISGGMVSLAMGESAIAYGNYSTAIGNSAFAGGNYSTSLGNFTTASGDYATALGQTTTASGGLSTAMGYYTTASGATSFVLGQYASSTATNSFTIGYGVSKPNPLINSTANSLAVGFNSTVPTLMVTGGSGAGTYGSVAIATTTANSVAKLSVDGSVLFSGNSGATPASGPGARMMWIPSKAAFRAGAAVIVGGGTITDGTEWDEENIGAYSVALGSGTKASGQAASALGSGAFATGQSSTAIGPGAFAQGTGAIAMGYWGGLRPRALGDNSMALGEGAVTEGTNDYAFGYDVNAKGGQSMAMGFFTSSTAQYAITIGQGVGAGDNALLNSTANSLAVGFNSTVPTLMVTGGTGVGTTGEVLIATSTDAVVAANPAYTSKLFVDSGEAFIGETIYQQNRANYGLLITNPGFTANIILSNATSTESMVTGQGMYNYDLAANTGKRAAKFGINNTGINRQGYTLDTTGVDVKLETSNAAEIDNLRGGNFVVRPTGTGAASTTYGLDIAVNPQDSFQADTIYGAKIQIDNQSTASGTRQYGLYSLANANGTLSNMYEAYGGYFYAYNASTTYGIRAGVSPGTGNTGWAGWFDGDIYVNDGGTTSTIAGNLAVGQKLTQNCNGDCVDIAEQFSSSELVEPGDIVMIDTAANELLDSRGLLADSHGYDVVVKKTDIGYSSTIVGIVSTNPAITMNGDTTVLGTSGVTETMNPPVALAGRVPVKITDENGPIKAGDLLVSSSSTPGAAMKYDSNRQVSGVSGQVSIIGMALTSFDYTSGQTGLEPDKNKEVGCEWSPRESEGAPALAGTPTPCHQGKVLVMIKNNYIQPSGIAADGLGLSVSDDGKILSTRDMDMGGNAILNVKSITSVSGNWSIDEGGHLIVKKVTAEEYEIDARKKADLDPTLGRARIPAGINEILVNNNRVHKNSNIVITFYGNPGGTWWISNQEDGWFKVTLSVGTGSDIDFRYWILSVLEDSDYTDMSGLHGAAASTPDPVGAGSVGAGSPRPTTGDPMEVRPPTASGGAPQNAVVADPANAAAEVAPLAFPEVVPPQVTETDISENPPSSAEIPITEAATSTP